MPLSLNNPDLKQIIPWCGTHSKAGPAIVETFINVGRYWETKAFNIEAIFESGENILSQRALSHIGPGF